MKTRKQVRRTNVPDNGYYIVGKTDKWLRRKEIRTSTKKLIQQEMKEIEEVTMFDETEG